jgi:chaperonin GroES
MAKKTKKTAKKASPKKSSAKPAPKAVAKAPVQPLADRVLVRRDDVPEKKSASGIILPDNAQKEKSKLGTVIAVGPGRLSDSGDLIAPAVSVGDKVIFNSGWDNEVTLEEDVEHFLVRESDILAILN